MIHPLLRVGEAKAWPSRAGKQLQVVQVASMVPGEPCICAFTMISCMLCSLLG
jgi:hypothetical protein